MTITVEDHEVKPGKKSAISSKGPTRREGSRGGGFRPRRNKHDVASDIVAQGADDEQEEVVGMEIPADEGEPEQEVAPAMEAEEEPEPAPTPQRTGGPKLSGGRATPKRGKGNIPKRDQGTSVNLNPPKDKPVRLKAEPPVVEDDEGEEDEPKSKRKKATSPSQPKQGFTLSSKKEKGKDKGKKAKPAREKPKRKGSAADDDLDDFSPSHAPVEIVAPEPILSQIITIVEVLVGTGLAYFGGLQVGNILLNQLVQSLGG